MENMDRPEKLTKPKLRELLINLGIEIPKGKVLKGDLVQLYKQYKLNQTAGYSSEEDADSVPGVPEVTVMKNVTVELERLEDKTITEMLQKRGVNVGPIVESTRAVYVNKLRKLVDEEEGDELNASTTTHNVSHNDSHTIVADIRVDDDYSDEDDDEEIDVVTPAPTVHLSNGDESSAGDRMNGTPTNQKVEVIHQQEEVVVEKSFTHNEVIVMSQEPVLTHRSHAAAADPVVETQKQKVVTRKRSSSSTICTFLTRVFLFLLSMALLALFFFVVQTAVKDPERLKLLK